MGALLIDEAAREKIDTLRRHALDHPLSIQHIRQMQQGSRRAIGDDPQHCIHLERGIRVVFSVDSTRSGQFVRHLSVSLDKADAWPNEFMVEELMRLFKFRGGLYDKEVYVHEDHGPAQAVNVQQLL